MTEIAIDCLRTPESTCSTGQKKTTMLKCGLKMFNCLDMAGKVQIYLISRFEIFKHWKPSACQLRALRSIPPTLHCRPQGLPASGRMGAATWKSILGRICTSRVIIPRVALENVIIQHLPDVLFTVSLVSEVDAACSSGCRHA